MNWSANKTFLAIALIFAAIIGMAIWSGEPGETDLPKTQTRAKSGRMKTDAKKKLQAKDGKLEIKENVVKEVLHRAAKIDNGKSRLYTGEEAWRELGLQN